LKFEVIHLDANVLKKYSKFIFAPITIYLLPEARDRDIDPDDLERLAKYFHDAVTDELTKSGRYEIVTTSRAGCPGVKCGYHETWSLQAARRMQP
jgi:hypothetical protein